MKNWEEKTLNELGTVGRGKSRHRPRNAPHLYGGEYPFIQTGDIEAASFYIESYSNTYTKAGLAQSKLWAKNTLCISIVGANTGATAILDFDACFPDSVIGFVPKSELSDVKFVKYSLELLRTELKSISEGAARENLSLEKLLSVKIPTPLIEYQKKIVSIISSYDDLIKNNLKRIKLLEEMAQITYEEWFVRFKIEGVPLEIDVETGLPLGWNRRSLSSIGEFLNGYAFKPEDWQEEGMPIIKIKELKNGIGNDTPRNIGIDVPKKYVIQSGDILFSWSASLEVVQWQGETGLLNQHLFKVTPQKNISKALLFLALKNSLSVFNNLTTGATMKHIKRKELDFVEIAIPPQELINQFENKVSPLLNLILSLNFQNRLLKEARDILLPRLMNGEIAIEG